MTRTLDERIASDLLDWVLLSGVIAADPPDIHPFLVSRDEIRVDDVWKRAGLAGTGSDDTMAKNVLVSEARSEPLVGAENYGRLLLGREQIAPN